MRRSLNPTSLLSLMAAGIVSLGVLIPGMYLLESVARAEDEVAAEAAAEGEVDPNPPSSVKMEQTRWPGLVTIFNGHNWQDDKPFITALKECGFGAAGCTEWQVEDVAAEGMLAYVFLWAHESATVPQNFVENDAVLCYYYSDRIPPDRWAGEWATYERQSYAGDPFHPAMMTQTIHWGGHDQFCEVVRGRALEYYHYHWDGGRKPEYYFHFLEVFRQVSLANNHVPICRICESRAEDVRKTRQTIFTSLAYGVRGFKTGGRGLFDFENRDERGVPARTELGDDALYCNKAIAAYSPVFEKARSVDVFHTAPLPISTKEAPEGYWVRPTGEEIVLGEFADPESETDDTRWLVVANRDAFNPREATLHFAAGGVGIERMNRDTAEWEAVATTPEGDNATVTISLIEGDGELLKVIGGQWPERGATEE